jgi:GTP-binding protein
MQITSARYLISAERVDQSPDHSIPEICFIGRSNVGKSSLINSLTNHPRLAKTSGTPGKTRLLNFFIINDGAWCLVDLPGYGYAKVSQEQREKWDKTMMKYMVERKNLALIVMLVDSRHDPLEKDLDMVFWLAENQLPFILVMTKADKLSKSAQKQSQNKFKKALDDMNVETDIMLTSASTKDGMDALRDVISGFLTDSTSTESS